MLYLNEDHLRSVGINWHDTIGVIERVVKCLASGDFSQPVKPYLRYRDLKNRIIAMPAFVGGGFDMAGIKWIASFPDNLQKGFPRAHSTVILNNAETGEPVCMINTAFLSIIRTASVSGLMIQRYGSVRSLRKIKLGIIGWGPIGQYHCKMCHKVFGNKIDRTYVYDIRKIDNVLLESEYMDKVVICDDWPAAYTDADLVITCTVAKSPYITLNPKTGSLHLNVSLRDYSVEVFEYFKDAIIVDSWDEVCRENTDIERMHREKGLQKNDTKTIIDVVLHNAISDYAQDAAILFNPMGMAVFDIALASFYYRKALESRVGVPLI